MLLFPKKTKFSKSFSGKKITTKQFQKQKANRFANLALTTLEAGSISNFQLEAIRRFLRRFLKKKAQIFFRIFPNIPITKKPNEVRLGRGRGSVAYWTSHLKKGATIVEVKGLNENIVARYLKAVRVKISLKTTVVNRKKRWIF